MEKFKKILKSLSIRETLNPKVWVNYRKPQNAQLRPKVKDGLENISEEFLDFLDQDVFVDDIILTGSLSNYNWSDYSDFDLHIVVDYDQFEDDGELYKELFDLKKIVFNEKHDIKIHGFDVEVYVQDSKESHFASGVYSIMNGEWITKPKKTNFNVDEKVLEKKIKCWVDKIETAVSTKKIEDDEEVFNSLKDKLKDYRQSGLEKKGEFSYENLVFKFLRRSGHIEKLFNSLTNSKDKKLSVENRV